MKDKNDRKVIILSVIVAIIMWGYVMTTTNPSLSKTVRNVPLIITNLNDIQSDGYEVVDRDELPTISVTVEGARDVLMDVSADNLVASVTVASIDEGIKSINLKIDSPAGVKVLKKEPNQINLKLEKVIEKQLSVDLEVTDDIKDGKILEVNENSPTEITVKGLRTVVDSVEKIVASVDDEDYLNGKIHNIPVKAYDKDNKEVTDVVLSAKEVSVSYIVSTTKEVEIKAQSSAPLSGYSLISLTTVPTKVIIKGQNDIISKIDSIETEEIDISTLKKTTTGEVELNLPDGVEIYDGDIKVNYTAEIEKDASSK